MASRRRDATAVADRGSVNVREATWPDDEPALEALRRRVFIEEQGVPREIEWDGRDGDARHVIAEVDGGAVGCGRILPGGRIGRLAVLPPWRDRGVGRALLDALLDLARQDGLPDVHLHAQSAAIAFYQRAGFHPRGEPFDEAGIAHVDMHRDLDYSDLDRDLVRVRYPAPFDALVVAQARLARRELAVLSPRLDPRVFDREPFHAALRTLIRRERQALVRVLVMDARALTARGHGLLELARRAPTKVAIRRLKEHPDWNGDTQVLRDRDSLLALPGGERDPGFYRPGDRARCETARGRFDELWRAGVVDPEFRALSI